MKEWCCSGKPAAGMSLGEFKLELMLVRPEACVAAANPNSGGCGKEHAGIGRERLWLQASRRTWTGGEVMAEFLVLARQPQAAC